MLVIRAILCLVAAFFATFATSAHAEELILKPDSKWVADFGEDNCRLIRTFGKSDEQTVLIIEQIAPSTDFNWTVAGTSLARVRWSRDVEVRWGPEFQSYEKRFLKADLGKFGPAFVGKGWEAHTVVQSKVKEKELRELGRAELASGLEPVLAGLDEHRASRVEYLSFWQGDRMKTTLLLEDMRAAIAALNKCTLDLATSWGFDESYKDRLTTKAIWLNARDVATEIQRNYPSRALTRGSQANFRMRIIVGVDGRAERCDWINDTSADNFDMSRTPCDVIMKKAEFEPALDENDRPIRSIYQTSVLYRIG
ncbi:hypothetical protein [Erythrobacter sp.]|uniref:hypothetical protein n=1 Tax=Erythrobacter sp. TaxID=1042 RepID=UPI001B152D09|nr:hypothetical protein [Erythrobacter sp.]MBO6527273.1 hypothetical protein [Erythrobacter sp.]MBO6530981.1 hypothetical protein [Erythrobacter sp.]